MNDETPDIILCRRQSTLCGRHLEYSLIQHSSDNGIEYYDIDTRISYGNYSDEITVSVGNDRVRAEIVFSLLADNCVTPCCVEEVLQDYESVELNKKY